MFSTLPGVGLIQRTPNNAVVVSFSVPGGLLEVYARLLTVAQVVDEERIKINATFVSTCPCVASFVLLVHRRYIFIPTFSRFLPK